MNENDLKYLLTLPPEEIVKWYSSKSYTFSWNWRDVWQDAHVRAFTVAKVMKLDILQSIKNEVDKIFKEGITYDEFVKNLEPELRSLGWWDKVRADQVPGYDPNSAIDPGKMVQLGSPRRLSTIYQTNTNVAYNAARYKFQTQNIESRPYWLYNQIDRPSKRKAHERYAGKVFRADDPIWDKIYPPNGFNCFPKGTEVLSEDGWKQIQKIKSGEYVLGGSGKYRLVNSTSRRKFHDNLIRFVTENGSASSTPNHRVLTLRGWVRAENLKVGDILVQIPEAASFDKAVSNINHSDTSRSEKFMPLPIERESCVGNTLDSELKFGDENINPIRRYIKIKDRFIAGSLKMSDDFLFKFCRLKFIIRMKRRVDSMIENFSLAHFCSNVNSSCGSLFRKFGSAVSNSFIVEFSFAKSRMFVSFIKLLHIFAEPDSLLNASLVSANPLGFDGVAPLPRLNTKMLKQSHDSPLIHIPAQGECVITEKFVEIEEPEGFAGGAPLDLFDSLQSFGTWSRSHCILNKVISVSNVLYNGNIYNIGVDKDETYLIRKAVVHNCGCFVTALTADEVAAKGLTVQNGANVKVKVGEGWGYNPGKELFTPDLTQYDADLSAAFKANNG